MFNTISPSRFINISVVPYTLDMGELDATTRPAKRGLLSPRSRELPLATVRGGRDPSDATRAENERTIHQTAGRTILLGRSSSREIIGEGIVKDGDKIIIDVKAR